MMTDSVVAPESAPSIAGAAVAPAIETPAAPSVAATLYPDGDKPADAPADPPIPPVEGDKPPEDPKPVEAKDVPVPPIDPASYAITLPENFTIDPEAMTAFTTIAAEAKLSPEQAQSLADLVPALVEKQLIALNEANTKAFQDLRTTWQTEVKSMPEFTGEENSTRNLAAIGRLMDEFGTPEVRQALNLTGAGDNPQIVRLLLNVANALVEGSPPPPARGNSNPKGRTPGQILYPQSNS